MIARSRTARIVTVACLAVAISGWQAAWALPDAQKIEQRLTPDQMHETGLDTLSPAQLQRLNEILHGQAAAEARIAASEAPRSSPPAAAERGGASYLGLDESPITTRLKGSVSHWQPGTEFVLENGQTWKVLKGNMKLRKRLESPVVVLVPGFAGRWFLQVDEDAPKARVYRID